ncbi:hypothetical protein AURDEDRAFT_169869 [Auricularia subglabra TFB-10046 SS5]|nr:hypothetical protein AURDEDRAFT_169869 [Auricularia subglabra TFB-10046 SS5]
MRAFAWALSAQRRSADPLGFATYEKTCKEQQKEILALTARLEEREASERAAVHAVATLKDEIVALKKQHADELAEKDRKIKRLKEKPDPEGPDDSPRPPKRCRRGSTRIATSEPQSEAEAEPKRDPGEEAMNVDEPQQQHASSNTTMRDDSDGQQDEHAAAADAEDAEADEGEAVEELEGENGDEVMGNDSEYQRDDSDIDEDDIPLTELSSPVRKSARIAKSAPVSYVEVDPNTLDDEEEEEEAPQAQSDTESTSRIGSGSSEDSSSGADEEDDTPDTSVIDGDDSPPHGPTSGQPKDLRIGCKLPYTLPTFLSLDAGDGETMLLNE